MKTNKKSKQTVDQNGKQSKNSLKRAVKGVKPLSKSFDLFRFASAVIVFNSFSLGLGISHSIAVTLVLIGYSGSSTVTSLTRLQYGNSGRSSYRNMQYRLVTLLDRGLIVNDGSGNYSLSSECVDMLRSVLVEGESAKILQEIDRRISRSEAYRMRKAKNSL